MSDSERRAPIISRETVAKRERSPDKDAHSAETRLAAYDEREAQRAARIADLRRGYTLVADKSRPPKKRKRGRFVWHTKKLRVKMDTDDWGLYVVAGDKGSGKSLAMAALAQKAWCEEGRMVFSNLGYEFGFHLTIEQIYTAIVGMPANSVLLIDEAHQPLATIGSSSLKHLSMRQMMAGLRKKGQKIILMSSQPDNIDGRILDEADWAMTPRPSYPGKERTRNRKGKFAFAGRPWLWKWILRVGPHPYKRRKGRVSDIFAAYGANIHGSPVRKSRLIIPPHRLWDASKSYDSFAGLLNPMETGMGVKAEDIRAGLSEGSPGWIEFADEETLMGTMASPAELEAQAQRKSFEHAKYQAFLNALVNEIRGRQPQPREGSYSMAWAAEQATNFVSEISPDSDDPDDYDMPSWLGHLWMEYQRLPGSERAQVGNPVEFTEKEARYYLSLFLGQEGRTFSMKRLWDAIGENQRDQDEDDY